jgi:hypothetical protein
MAARITKGAFQGIDVQYVSIQLLLWASVPAFTDARRKRRL